jgi:16S rRNA (cytosine967-C5)-methyltransferase
VRPGGHETSTARSPRAPRRDARAVAVEALVRVEEGAYANLVLPALLDRSDLSGQDRRFVTELVYGTTRMQRACDWLVDRFLMRAPDAPTRAVLRLGAYQLQFLQTPAHAAVSATVSCAPGRTRGLVNAVLRRVASAGPPDWPSDAVRLSYPDWIVDRLVADIGGPAAMAALIQMNEPAEVTRREDGYTQDQASQWVAAALGAGPGDRIADLCAAPGGKATALAAAGAGLVVGLDIRPGRARLVASNAAGLGLSVAAVVGDGAAPPLRPGAFDRILVDAPCSGLGVLRRRPDARWRVTARDVEELASLQRRLLAAAVELLRPGGVLAYSVCTLTAAETVDVDGWLATEHPSMVAIAPPSAPWTAVGRGARLLPQAAGTDGMFVLLARRVSVDSPA